MTQSKLKKMLKWLSFCTIAILLCLVTWIFIFSQLDCTFNENKVPSSPRVPDNTVLVSVDDLWRRNNLRNLTTNYVISNITREEIVAFFETETNTRCLQNPDDASSPTACGVLSSDIGDYVVTIQLEDEQQQVYFTIVQEWKMCNLDWNMD